MTLEEVERELHVASQPADLTAEQRARRRALVLAWYRLRRWTA